MSDEEQNIPKTATTTDVSRETLDRGQWDTFMRGELQAMRDIIRAQNPFPTFEWNRTPALAVGDWLDMPGFGTSNIFYSADSLSVVVGNPGASVLADLQVPHDGNIYQLIEVAGAPGMD